MSSKRGSRIRLFAGLLFFCAAIGSLWLGLLTSPELLRFSGWYVASVLFAILGVVAIGLPSSRDPVKS